MSYGEAMAAGEFRVVVNNGELYGGGRLKTREQFEQYTSMLFYVAGVLWPEPEAEPEAPKKKRRKASWTPERRAAQAEWMRQRQKSGGMRRKKAAP